MEATVHGHDFHGKPQRAILVYPNESQRLDSASLASRETSPTMTSTEDPADAHYPEDPALWPNTTKRRRTPTSQSDEAAEGEPAPELAKMASPESAAGDVSVCRICRGEDTPNEPLFYPCKCSGSIKYVHQDCLMEWLSHSQKKHCELCKTPFRFTKLYSPDMPHHLPSYVFASHMTKYILRNTLVWLRAALVTSVWLGWLPYLMRSVWSFLFWISDEGFGHSPASLFDGQNSTSTQLHQLAASMTSQGLSTTTCPSSPLYPATTTAATTQRGVADLPGFLRALGQPLNFTGSMFMSFATRAIFGGGTSASTAKTTLSLNQTHALEISTSINSQHSSLLSEVNLLKNLTRHPRINQIVISVLEGQIITILFIICFILIILVRDYVVQQQPEINMRAAFAAQENIVDEAPLEPLQPDLRGPDLETDDSADDDDSVMAQYDLDDQDDQDGQSEPGESRGEQSEPVGLLEPAEPIEPQERPIAGFRRRLTRRTTQEEPVDNRPSHTREHIEDLLQSTTASLGDDSQTTVNQYLRIYRKAGGDHEKVLRIIHEEGLEERLAYWVHVTQDMVNLSKKNSAENSSSQAPPANEDHVQDENNAPDNLIRVESDFHLNGTQGNGESSDTKQDRKGKGKAIINQPTGELEVEWDKRSGERMQDWAQPRPRAVSDGPQPHTTIHPLANNSWSFTHLAPGTAADITSSEGTPRHTPQSSDDGDNAHALHDEDTAGDSAESETVATATIAADDSEPTGANEEVPGSIAPRQPVGIVDRVADFMWGDIDATGGDEIVPGPVELFVDNQHAPFAGARRDNEVEGDEDDDEDDDDEEEDELDADVVEAAVAAGLDPEALEDAEDFDGIMELIGMRGPIAGLFQNAIFCAFLVSITIFLGIFIPYNIGRFAVWIAANPTRIVRMVFSFSKFVQDIVLLGVGWTLETALGFLTSICRLFRIRQGVELLTAAVTETQALTATSLNRIFESFLSEIPLISSGEIQNFSALSHESLISVKSQIHSLFSAIGNALVYIFGGDYSSKWVSAQSAAGIIVPQAWESLKNMSASVTQPSSWVIDLSLPARNSTVDPALAYWGARDRALAILSGYVSVSLMSAMYLGRGSPFSSSQAAQDWETSIIEGLNQASGVMKVILIISIEMLIFPLYCGLLLDFALLPLFEGVSLGSRLMFTYNYPLTSIFVHWFVGTGYMFHFALFVSMCRKIMRKGVLYFIRDPDDPEFHPVRDVLERTVTTQLRKILFSAFVYGALVVICLGGVVWGLSLTLPQVLPIHYSSNEPVLEFPIDLLFYNFCMPLAVRVFKPSEGLSAMYSWWFRRCARALRLTWFLFGDRRIDEEGTLKLKADTGTSQAPWYRRLFLEVSSQENRVEPTPLAAIFEGNTKSTSPEEPVSGVAADKMNPMNLAKSQLVNSGQLVPDGRFVRTPASDQVKIPKGRSVFIDVDENNRRLDGKPDHRVEGNGEIHNNNNNNNNMKHYQLVYIPPHFRVRVFLFILFIWLFAAVTGVSFTIVPLIFGRRVFKALLPAHIKTNDIYAFSIGVYVLGSLGYAISHAKTFGLKTKEWIEAGTNRLPRFDHDTMHHLLKIGKHGCRLAYTYAILLAVFPLIVTLLVELYLLLPLHTWKTLGHSPKPESQFSISPHKHTIRVIQSWTLGLLYLKIGAKVLTMYGGRPAHAVRAVLRRGWMEPDVTVLTRAFVIPGVLLFTALTFLPPIAASVGMRAGFLTIGSEATDAKQWKVIVFRLSYPVAAMAAVNFSIVRRMLQVLSGWRARVRDEAYLIGERLHNFHTVALPSSLNGKGTRNGEWRNGARL